MQYSKAANSYKKNTLENASPGQLILMLYDGALKFIDAAKLGFKETKTREFNEKINNNISRALEIIAELKACLDLSVEGDFPKTMYSLYEYMEDNLSRANVKKEQAPLDEVRTRLLEIRNAWDEMLKKNPEPDTQTTSISCSA